MNPYHKPETAAAIWNAAINGNVSVGTRAQLLDLIEGVKIKPPISHTNIISSIEIVLSSVKMNEPMRRDLLRERVSIGWERGEP